MELWPFDKFVCVFLWQIMILDYKLTYPSGTATGILINSFHSPGGVAIAKYALHCALLRQDCLSLLSHAV